MGSKVAVPGFLGSTISPKDSLDKNEGRSKAWVGIGVSASHSLGSLLGCLFSLAASRKDCFIVG